MIAFSTAEKVRVPYKVESDTQSLEVVPRDLMSLLFMAAIGATEEAILNSLFMAETTKGPPGTIEALPIPKVLPVLKEYEVIKQKI